MCPRGYNYVPGLCVPGYVSGEYICLRGVCVQAGKYPGVHVRGGGDCPVISFIDLSLLHDYVIDS